MPVPTVAICRRAAVVQASLKSEGGGLRPRSGSNKQKPEKAAEQKFMEPAHRFPDVRFRLNHTLTLHFIEHIYLLNFP
jgi:hypothetical protein